jgi:hypothetical protein
MGTNTPPGADLTGSAPGSDATMGELPPDAVEVVEVVTLEGGPNAFSDADLYGDQYGAPGFRWWYVPAAAVPVIAGGALFWYLRNQNRKQPFKGFSDLMGRRGNEVTSWVQGRVGDMRRQTPAVKHRTATVAGMVATAPVWDRAGDWIGGRLDDFSDLIDRDHVHDHVHNAARTSRGTAKAKLAKAAVATKATKATKAAVTSSNRWNDFTDTLGDTWEDASDTVLGWWEGVRGSAKPSAKTKAVVAVKAVNAVKAANPVSSVVSAISGARDSTTKAAKKTGKSVNSAYNRTRTFTFAMLVTAMYTYMRVRRQRMAERTMRETASGRLVPDREPTFSR